MFRNILALTGVLVLYSCSTKEPKINGASLEMPRNEIHNHELSKLKEMNVDWVAMIPYAFSRPEETFVRWGEGHWWGENPEGIIKCIKMAHEEHIKVMLKPHVWVGGGQGWLGDFDFEEDSKWADWEAEYRDYIVSYAMLADSLNVEMLCIGTEVRKSVVKRPQFWRDLTKEVRKVYSGKVTYAANWDNYKNVTFWSDLDYIGVDAYFPLSSKARPTVDELVEGWGPIAEEIGELSEKEGRPVLFTEYGYKSIEYTNSGHWRYREDSVATSHSNQAIAYEALYQSVWEKEWMAGGFFWKYHFDHMMNDSHEYLTRRYTPQGKETEAVIREWYGVKNE